MKVETSKRELKWLLCDECMQRPGDGVHIGHADSCAPLFLCARCLRRGVALLEENAGFSE